MANSDPNHVLNAAKDFLADKKIIFLSGKLQQNHRTAI